MNAIALLKSQHREVESLFAELGKAKRAPEKRKLFELIADKLAIHAAIEEHQFYPSVKAKQTEDVLLESLEEHLGIKRVITDLLQITASDETFEAKVKVLEEQVSHHVGEEESDLFPKVKKLFSAQELESLGQAMEDEGATIERDETAPRAAVPAETVHATPLR